MAYYIASPRRLLRLCPFGALCRLQLRKQLVHLRLEVTPVIVLQTAVIRSQLRLAPRSPRQQLDVVGALPKRFRNVGVGRVFHLAGRVHLRFRQANHQCPSTRIESRTTMGEGAVSEKPARSDCDRQRFPKWNPQMERITQFCVRRCRLDLRTSLTWTTVRITRNSKRKSLLARKG